MKPGQSANISNPTRSASTGVADAQSVASGSNQTPLTAGLSSDPNRCSPAQRDAGPSGTAEVERDGIMPNQTSNASESLKTTYAKRRQING